MRRRSEHRAVEDVGACKAWSLSPREAASNFTSKSKKYSSMDADDAEYMDDVSTLKQETRGS